MFMIVRISEGKKKKNHMVNYLFCFINFSVSNTCALNFIRYFWVQIRLINDYNLKSSVKQLFLVVREKKNIAFLMRSKHAFIK